MAGICISCSETLYVEKMYCRIYNLNMAGRRVRKDNEAGMIVPAEPSKAVIATARRSISDIAIFDKYSLMLPFFTLRKEDSMRGKVISILHTDGAKIELEIEYAPYADLPKKILLSMMKEISWYVINNIIPSSGYYWVSGSISDFLRRYGFYGKKEFKNPDKYIHDFKRALADLYRASYIPKCDYVIQHGNHRFKVFAVDKKIALVEGMKIVEGYSPQGETRKKILGVKFPDWIINSIKSGFISVINYTFWDSLSTPMSKRVYELLLPRFYANYKNGGKKVKTVKVLWSYRKLCDMLPASPRGKLSEAKRQLDRAFTELVERGFIASKPEWNKPAYEEYDIINAGDKFVYTHSPDWLIVFEAGSEFFRQVEKEERVMKEFSQKPSILENLLFSESLPVDFQIEKIEEIQPLDVESERVTETMNNIEFFQNAEQVWDFIERNCLWKADSQLDIEFTRKNLFKICDYIVKNKIGVSIVKDWCVVAEAQDNAYGVIAAFIQKVKDYIKERNLDSLFISQRITFEKLRRLLVEIGYDRDFVKKLKQSELVPAFVEFAYNDFTQTNTTPRSYTSEEIKRAITEVKKRISEKFYNGQLKRLPYRILNKVEILDLNRYEKSIIALALYGYELKNSGTRDEASRKVVELIKAVLDGKNFKNKG